MRQGKYLRPAIPGFQHQMSGQLFNLVLTLFYARTTTVQQLPFLIYEQ